MFLVPLLLCLAISLGAGQRMTQTQCNLYCPSTARNCPQQRPGGLSSDCQNGWIKYDDSCLIMIDKLQNWQNAKADCESRGGFLFTASDQNEINTVLGAYAVRNAPVWIGLSADSAGNQNWEDYYSGMDINSLPWLEKTTTHGRNSVRACVAYFKPSIQTTNPYVNWFACTNLYYAICEVRAGYNPRNFYGQQRPVQPYTGGNPNLNPNLNGGYGWNGK